MRIGRLEIWWYRKSSFTKEEKVELGIIDLPQALLDAYGLINRYNEKHKNDESKIDTQVFNPEYKEETSEEMIKRIEHEDYLKRQKEREENRLKLERKQKEARDFKDYQRRANAGLLTPEEKAEQERKRKDKAGKYYKKHK